MHLGHGGVRVLLLEGLKYMLHSYNTRTLWESQHEAIGRGGLLWTRGATFALVGVCASVYEPYT